MSPFWCLTYPLLAISHTVWQNIIFMENKMDWQEIKRSPKGNILKSAVSMSIYPKSYFSAKYLASPDSYPWNNFVVCLFGFFLSLQIGVFQLNFSNLFFFIFQIKFLKSKEGCAMIQMGDPLSVERAVSNLNGSVFFDSKLQLG